eukprot:CAMPEP_0172451674 /NCGR_PEP_ID=MMETSP1065-20121228/9615_1 /TAXON_ID=265537 /ORGANISM="Amphiprora paludosa, Strain CCMP125" /LENGTH=249 /DNA_ID=CAMNT_0013203641 /DNA_START=1 /DNA_END=750 /DNA_ORIENTATION=+
MTTRTLLLLVALVAATTTAFVPLSTGAHHRPLSALDAKKKGKKPSAGQGFGKATVEAPVTDGAAVTVSESEPAPEIGPSPPSTAFLQSIDGGSTERPMADANPEDRAKALLRQKYGMKTLEEERLDQKQREQLQAQRKKIAELKAKADDDDFDFIMMIPPPVLQGIYTFLKLGIGTVGTTFLLSGLFITLEAWSKASGSPLPDNIDGFIVNIVEPYFTNQLLVLLGFSVTLGLLATAQLGSKAATYREE